MNRKYEEMALLPITNQTTIVLSEVHQSASSEEGLLTDQLRGYSVTKYVESPEYTGFSRGIFVPTDRLIAFLKMFPRESLKLALNGVNHG
jgi:hypothetical protein